MPTALTPKTAPLGLQAVNALSEEAFVHMLGDVFEHSPWVASRAFAARPFADISALHTAMVHEMQRASQAEKLALLCAHPELAGKAAQRGELTHASTQEQSRAGLNALHPHEMQRITDLNAAYRARHGFPFIVCVGQHTKDSIFSVFAQRVTNAPAAEQDEALRQVAAIALLRLHALISP
ncbi:MAG: 2-oxo-4-hydroxy-4-carboxy-5-ureidoimidazoline decarboxylase [Rhodoferax sp.]|nr:2-oxo-4-hydroxy-4-carboxy-5-ureidoimidazoline decarboxylase [Rhodoferax sp.]